MRAALKVVSPEWAKPALRVVERTLIRAVRRVHPGRLPAHPAGKVLLNVGCGSNTHPAFINVDMLPAWHIHYIRPIDNLRPFQANSVDLVYASHCLEHFSHTRVNAVLAEWHRVLKPGGVLRLGVPNFDALVEVYEASGRNIDSIQEYLMGGQSYALNAHFTAFNFQGLSDRLMGVGFREIREWRRNTDDLTSIPDFTNLAIEISGKTFQLSLNLEATK